MALAAGEKCAEQTMGDAIQPSGGPNFVTTLWRGSGTTDWTNELGYLFIGQPNSAANLKWTYYAGFSPAALTNLDTNDIEPCIRWTNSQQGAFTNEISGFMNTATNGFSTNPAVAATSQICTLLPLLGGRTSPPVGWVYLRQDKRIPGTTTITNVPVARCAWFMEDLSGMIDAEQMGAQLTRDSGTNPEEISLNNLLRTNGQAVLPNLASITNPTQRKMFFTPGLLATNAGLTNTNDLRYFASGLREWRPTNTTGTNGTVSWIPGGIFARVSNNANRGYALSGYLKMDLNRLVAKGAPSNFVNFIKDNLPDFTNRAGGMNGNIYLSALAANMIDYVDADASPTTTTVGGIPVAGFDNVPLPTLIFDCLKLSGSNLTVTSYWQFWNCSTVATADFTYSYSYDFADTLGSYITPTKTNVVNNRMTSGPWTGKLSIPSVPAGGCYIASITNQVSLNIPAADVGTLTKIWINGTNSGQITTNNAFSLALTNGTIISQMQTGFERKAKTVANNGAQEWSGGMPGLRYDNVTGSFKVPPSGDPRMLNFLTNGLPNGYLSACDYNKNVEWQLGFAQTRNSVFNGSPYSGSPAYWVDGRNSSATSVLGSPYDDTTNPPLGLTNAKVPAIAILSTNGSFTNICELGNIMDPIQWVSTSITKPSDWVDCNIAGGNTWSTNTMYGGGQTLRIGRAEHSRFAFTNLGTAPASQPIPNMGQSAVAFLDLFCISNPSSASANGIYRTGGKININTAPAPVLAALAGGINLTKDTNKAGAEVNATMISAFTNGVMRFRSVYPFLTPSQLAFISANYGTTGWTNSANWTLNAVFSTNNNGGLKGVTGINDEGREEWFAKIYGLTTVSSVNYRFYIAAQLVDSNTNAIGPIARKYCQFAGRPDTTTSGANTNTNYGVDIFSWARTTGQKKVYESPY